MSIYLTIEPTANHAFTNGFFQPSTWKVDKPLSVYQYIIIYLPYVNISIQISYISTLW